MMSYACNLRVYTEKSAVPEYAGFQVGFRCARDVDPGEEGASQPAAGK